MKRPAFQFYPADWRKDAALQSCSLAARGLWHEMMCLMHECEPYGHMSINGKPMKAEQVARLVGISDKDYAKLLAELQEAGVPSVSDDGCIYSRRMVKDEHLRNVRAEAGKKGGNPSLVGSKVEGKVNQNLNHPSKQVPTPSSSASSSTTETTNPPQPPLAGGSVGTLAEQKSQVKAERMTLRTFLDRCNTAGERAISGYAPLERYIEESGLPVDFVNLCWAEFKRDFLPGGKNEKKQQARWRQHFQNFVERNFYRLWYAKQHGDSLVYELTTVGLQAQLAQANREAA
jgi:hypothetical protein